MRKSLLFLGIFTSLNLAFSQSFPDQIITTGLDTINCRITLVNDHYIFYEHKPKRTVLGEHIARTSIKQFHYTDSSITVLEAYSPDEKKETNETTEDYTEGNGIIYPSYLDKPPVYQSGIDEFYRYLQTTARIRKPDNGWTNEASVTIMLLALQLSEHGNILKIWTRYSNSTASMDYGFAAIAENRVYRLIRNSPAWQPAVVNDHTTACVIFLPLRVYSDPSKTIVGGAPSKFVVTYPKLF